MLISVHSRAILNTAVSDDPVTLHSRAQLPGRADTYARSCNISCTAVLNVNFTFFMHFARVWPLIFPVLNPSVSITIPERNRKLSTRL